jgi:hypothetical protein
MVLDESMLAQPNSPKTINVTMTSDSSFDFIMS